MNAILKRRNRKSRSTTWLPVRPACVASVDRHSPGRWLELLESRCLLNGIGPQGSEFRVNTYTGGAPRSACVAMNESGNTVVAWSTFEIPGHVGVYAQRYNRLGVPQGGEFRVSTYASDHINWQFASPAVAMSTSGSFVVTWISPEQDGSGGGIYAQRFGNPPGPPEFGDIPAVIDTGERSTWTHDNTGLQGLLWVTMQATDADTPFSSLNYAIDGATPAPGAVGQPYFSNWHYYYGYDTGDWLFVPIGDGPYQQTINIRVTDDTGLCDTATIVVNVANRAPSLSQGYDLRLNPLPGEAAQFSVRSTDIDAQQVWWDFGDGVVTPPQAMEWRTDNWSHYWHTTSSHIYPALGNYTATAYVRDDDGAVSTLKFNVTCSQFRLDYDGTLRVGGLPGNDNINVSPAAGGKVNLFIGGALKGVFAANSAVAYGNGGDDTLDSAENLNVPVEYHGGPGNDLLRGGMANDALFGEEGNDRIEGRSGHDILVGGIGNDRLRGCAGRDLLLAGTGFDSVYGDADDDILIAGPTSHDADLWALNKIRDEWISTRLYAVRIDNIRDGTGSGDRVNGSCFFKGGSTVFDDATEDWLCGVSGNDWFFASTATGDKLMDRAASEEVDAAFG